MVNNANTTTLCRLCFNEICDDQFTLIDEHVKEVMRVVLIELDLMEKDNALCSACFVKLFAAFNFKAKCIDTEDLLFPYLNSEKGALVDLRDIYLKENNVQVNSCDAICRLCFKIVNREFVSVNDVQFDIVAKFIPEVNFSCSLDPVICQPCCDSLYMHGDFLRKCEEIDEKIKVLRDDKDAELSPCIKVEEIDIKLEESDLECDSLPYSNNQSKAIEIPSSTGERISCDFQNTSEGSLLEHRTEKETHSKSRMYRRDGYRPGICDSQAEFNITPHNCQLLCRGDSTSQTYKCHNCDFETKDKRTLQNHLLVHRMRRYKCDICGLGFTSSRSRNRHQLVHKDPSEIQMHKCDLCGFETKYQRCLKSHQSIHKDRSQVQMYKCDVCKFETKRKSVLKRHKMNRHKPSAPYIYRVGE